jgi:hypothetical protein
LLSLNVLQVGRQLSSWPRGDEVEMVSPYPTLTHLPTAHVKLWRGGMAAGYPQWHDSPCLA